MKLLLLGLAAALSAWGQWGGELRFCLHSEPRTLHPALVDDEASETVRYLTGGVLVRVNRLTQQPEPALAVSWKVLEGGRAIRFQLREGVVFSDGTPFTADDVVYTIDTLVDPKLHSPVADSLRIEGGAPAAVAEGTRGVIIRFAAPLAGGARLFDQVAILSRQSPLREAAVLGPFVAADRKPGVYIRLVRNPHYWKMLSGRRLPYFDSVRLDIQQNRDTEFLRFWRGELDLVPSLDAGQFEELARRGTGEARDAGPSLESEFLWFNMAPAAPLPAHVRAWFGSRNFRLAVSDAIRRDDLCRVVYKGRAAPAAGPFPPANLFWCNRKLEPPRWDLDRARRRLAEDGFRAGGDGLRDREGHTVEFSLVTNAGNKARESMAALIQQDLAALGIKLNVVALDFPSILERIGKSLRYEACLLSFNNVDLDPAGQTSLWLSSSVNHAWNPKQAAPATAWEAEIDRLMRAQASEPDARRRKQLFDRVQEIAREQAPIIYLVNRNALAGVSASLANVQPSVLYPRVVWNADELYFTGAKVTDPLLAARISADYPGRPRTLDDVRFEIAPGEVFGLAGESGSGKSTVALAILRLLEMKGGRARGEILLAGRDLMREPESALRRLRGREVSLVMQSPSAALNPGLRIETQLREAWRVHGRTAWAAERNRIDGLLDRMGLPAGEEFLRRYPSQISVGQAQRVVIAMAVMHRPRLIVADEPTSALDPSSRGEILDLFRSLNREQGAAILYISHDTDSMAAICDRIGELRNGKMVGDGVSDQRSDGRNCPVIC